jgi:HlyD family secretion protein
MRVVIILLLLCAAGGAGAYFYMQEKPLEVTVGTVETGPVEETVASISSGAVIPKQRAMLAVGAIGTIAELHVEEGAKVEEGQVLVELEHAELDAQVELAKANLRVGESRREQAKLAVGMSEDVTSIQVRQAKAQLEAARAEYERVLPLSERQAISRSDFDKAQLALRVAEEVFAGAVAGQGENGVRAEDVTSAEGVLDQLRAAVTAAEAMREKAFLKAPFKGVVAKVMLKKGEAVAMGMPVLSLVSNEDVYIEAPFDEANAGELSVGLPVRIELDAYPNVIFDGTVSFISPVVQPNSDLARTLNLKIEIAGDRSKFLPGMSANVTVIAEKRENVVHVPSEALVRDEFAYVVENSRLKKRPVELGIGNWEYQEVLSGLSAGERIVTSIGIKGLEEGALVKEVAEISGS